MLIGIIIGIVVGVSSTLSVQYIKRNYTVTKVDIKK